MNGYNFKLSIMFRYFSTSSAKKALMITDNAAVRIRELIQMKPDPESIMGVRVGVRRRGCNGYSYVMNYAEQGEEVGRLDEVVEEKNVKVIVDSKALMFLIGTEMDYVDDEVKSEFVFNNPNSKGTCGCGESFTV